MNYSVYEWAKGVIIFSVWIGGNMINKILLVLDHSRPGVQAKRYALWMARKYNADMAGLALLDTPWITASQAEPIGVAALKQARDDAIKAYSHDTLTKLMTDFKDDCAEAGVRCSVQELEGFPAECIERYSNEHDVIVVGRTTDLHFELDDDTDVVVNHVARDNPRPVLIIPGDDLPEENTVIIAYDGRLQSSRALHMAILINMLQGSNIHIVTIDDHAEHAKYHADQAQKMLANHGLNASTHVCAKESSILDVINKKIDELQASMLIMGGYSHSAIRETLFGSNTRDILRNVKIPIFVHH